MRLIHPAEYNRELENQYEVVNQEDASASEWSEAGFTGHFINQFLIVHFPRRPVDQIMYRRRTPHYSRLLAQAKAGRDGRLFPVNEEGNTDTPEVHLGDDFVPVSHESRK